MFAEQIEKFFGRRLPDVMRQFRQELEQNERDETHAARVTYAKDLAEFEAACTAEHEAHSKAVAPLLAAAAQARATFEKADAALQECLRTHGLRAFELSHGRDRARNLLEQTAPPRIDAFRVQLRELIELTQQQLDVRQTRSWSGRMLFWSNNDSVEGRINAIHDASRALEALKLEVLSDDELEQRLQAILAALPVLKRAPDAYPAGSGGPAAA